MLWGGERENVELAAITGLRVVILTLESRDKIRIYGENVQTCKTVEPDL